jgi:hypothetical protein
MAQNGLIYAGYDAYDEEFTLVLGSPRAVWRGL